MKKISYFFLVIFTLLASCKEERPKTLISGKLQGLTNDTIFFYGIDNWYDNIDTIVADKHGHFSYEIDIDTITYGAILLNDKIEHPLFIDKYNHITIHGDATQPADLKITGNSFNLDYTAYLKEKELWKKLTTEEITSKIEYYIKKDYSSLINIYLIDDYFVQVDSIDVDNLENMINLMSGFLKDTPYIVRLKDQLVDLKTSQIDRYCYYYKIPNVKGDLITRRSEKFLNKAILLNFYASYADTTASKKVLPELKALYKKYKKSSYFNMLGVSFDTNKQQWKNSIDRDTLQWEQVSDLKGMNSELIRRFSISHFPSNLLITKDGKIVARDLYGDELTHKVDSICKVYKKNK